MPTKTAMTIYREIRTSTINTQLQGAQLGRPIINERQKERIDKGVWGERRTTRALLLRNIAGLSKIHNNDNTQIRTTRDRNEKVIWCSEHQKVRSANAKDISAQSRKRLERLWQEVRGLEAEKGLHRSTDGEVRADDDEDGIVLFGVQVGFRFCWNSVEEGK